MITTSVWVTLYSLQQKQQVNIGERASGDGLLRYCIPQVSVHEPMSYSLFIQPLGDVTSSARCVFRCWRRKTSHSWIVSNSSTSFDRLIPSMYLACEKHVQVVKWEDEVILFGSQHDCNHYLTLPLASENNNYNRIPSAIFGIFTKNT